MFISPGLRYLQSADCKFFVFCGQFLLKTSNLLFLLGPKELKVNDGL